MLVKRVLVTLVLLPIGLVIIYLGDWWYAGVIALILGLAAWEYVKLYRAAGLQPARLLVIPGAVLFALARALNGFESADWMVSLAILAAMTYHLAAYERGRDRAATDFAVTLGGIFYLGWIGAYMISLRQLPEGLWWLLLALPAVWLADSGAYLVGSALGRHKMTRRISPKKSWEGYLSGIAFAVIGGALLALAWGSLGADRSLITPPRGALLGAVIGSVAILGDLGVSMIKRQVGIKDSGNLLPGHGGAFDRIDTWVWAAVVGYYIVVWLFLR
jgi:phosphatidate cytidylyltransferase